jgi:phosphohistidine phosphatase SixA
MPRLLFLRHGARPERPRRGVSRPDLLTPVGEQQARAVARLLRAEQLEPALAVHTRTRRTAETTRLALAHLETPIRAESGAPRTLPALLQRLDQWSARAPRDGLLFLCAHHPTQQLLCRLLGLSIHASARALILVDVDGEDRGSTRLRGAWCCAEEEEVWRPVTGG